MPARAAIEPSITASTLELAATPTARRARGAGSGNALDLYLVRPAAASAAQALATYSVEMHAAARSSQIGKLREFRGDTQTQLADIQRWCASAPRRTPTMTSQGLISAGAILRLSPQEAAAMKRDLPGVQMLRNRLTTLVPPLQSLLADGQAPPADAGWQLEAIGQAAARRAGRAFSGLGVNVAVLDTGVDPAHPEYAARLNPAWRIDPASTGIDAASVILDAPHVDTHGHGTHVAGLLAGVQVGVAPSVNVTSVTMLPQGVGNTFSFIRCLNWALEHPEIALINCSAGIQPFDEDMMPFVADLVATGCLPFFAVGNSGENKTSSPGNYIDGISVGSVDPGDSQRVSAFSGSGRMQWQQTIYDVPDLVAPGAAMWSSYPAGRYAELRGTSMATPVACGVAACILERSGAAMTPADLTDELRRLCRPLPGEAPGRQGRGLVSVPTRA